MGYGWHVESLVMWNVVYPIVNRGQHLSDYTLQYEENTWDMRPSFRDVSNCFCFIRILDEEKNGYVARDQLLYAL